MSHLNQSQSFLTCWRRPSSFWSTTSASHWQGNSLTSAYLTTIDSLIFLILCSHELRLLKDLGPASQYMSTSSPMHGHLSLRKVQVNASLLIERPSNGVIELPGDSRLTFNQEWENHEYMTLRYSDANNSPTEYAMFTLRRSKPNYIIGIFYSKDGNVFTLDNCGYACHTWGQLDHDKLKECKFGSCH